MISIRLSSASQLAVRRASTSPSPSPSPLSSGLPVPSSSSSSTSFEVIKRHRRPRNYWSNGEHRSQALRELSARLGHVEGDLSAWYGVSYKSVVSAGGLPLIELYGKSVARMVSDLRPHFDWDTSRFKHRPHGFWQERKHQRTQLEAIGAALGIAPPNEDVTKNDTPTPPTHSNTPTPTKVETDPMSGWYRVRSADVVAKGGSAMLLRARSSVPALLRSIYLEHTWDTRAFNHRERAHWESEVNQRAFVDALGTRLGFAQGDYAQWYRVTTAHFRKHGGSALLLRYGGSPRAVVMRLYPEHTWEPWRFSSRTKTELEGDPGTALASATVTRPHSVSNTS